MRVGTNAILNDDPFIYSGTPKTCCACGQAFLAGVYQQRKCGRCRKPEVRVRSAQQTLGSALSFREQQVAKLAADGQLNKEIADVLKLSEGTVKQYLNRVYAKTGVNRKPALTRWWIECHREELGV